MAADRDEWASNLSAEQDGLMGSFLADEEPFDRSARWRLASWGVAAVGALAVAMMASQTSVQWRRDQIGSADMLARQAQQVQIMTRETQSEARRLASAIDTLTSDRDRLLSRVTSVEKNLDSVTGSVARQIAAAQVGPPAPLPQVTPPQPPSVAPVDSLAAAEPMPLKPVTPAAVPAPAPLVVSKLMMAPPDPAATRLSEISVPLPAVPDTTASLRLPEAQSVTAESPQAPVQRPEFGVDLGSANTVDGLRALWRTVSASNRKTLASLRPIIVLKERAGGYGTQLRLVAGPLGDAAAAAKLCASMVKIERTCETSVFEGQRLALRSDPPPSGASPPLVIRPTQHRRTAPHVQQQQPPKPETEVKPPEEPAPKPQPAISSFLGIRN